MRKKGGGNDNGKKRRIFFIPYYLPEDSKLSQPYEDTWFCTSKLTSKHILKVNTAFLSDWLMLGSFNVR